MTHFSLNYWCGCSTSPASPCNASYQGGIFRFPCSLGIETRKPKTVVRVLIKIIPSISLHFKDSLVHTPSHVGTVTCCETNPRLLLFFLLWSPFPRELSMGGWEDALERCWLSGACLPASHLQIHVQSTCSFLHESGKALLPISYLLLGTTAAQYGRKMGWTTWRLSRFEREHCYMVLWEMSSAW